MPITQDRLLTLIELYELNSKRVEELKNRSDGIYAAIRDSYEEKDYETMYAAIQALRPTIVEVTMWRREEYDVFMKEKLKLEVNANHNARSKMKMAQLRAKRRDIANGTYVMPPIIMRNKPNSVEGIAALIMTKIKESWDENEGPITIATFAWATDKSEGFISQQVIPYMLANNLLMQVEGGYLPKEQ